MPRHFIRLLLALSVMIGLCDHIPCPAAELQNGDFESGTLTGWTGWPTPAKTTVETTTSAHGGTHVARINFQNGVQSLLQDVASPASSLVPGKYYTFKVWYQYKTSMATDYPAITQHYEDGKGNRVGIYNNVGANPGNSTAWRPLQVSFKALDAPLLRLSLRGGMMNYSTGYALFDDATIEKLADEPHDIDIYLLMGQSNMAGMDKNYLDEDRAAHPRVFMLTTDKSWAAAVEPLHGSGVGPGYAFGRAMADHDTTRIIGLVPLAVGQTPISMWVKGGAYYKNTLAMAQEARKMGTIRGIVWHQGENDSYDPALANAYAGKLKGMITDLRQDLGVPNLPFVCGELGHFFDAAHAGTVRAAQLDLPHQVPLTAAVPSEGMTNMDPWHFDGASQRAMGQRYAAAMIGLKERPNSAKTWQSYQEEKR